MRNFVLVKKKINKLDIKSLSLPGDKSLSIRFIIFASLANGKSKAYNLLNSEDVKSTIKCFSKLGIKIIFKKNFCAVYGKGLFGLNYKPNIILDSGNSGTCARLIMASVVDTSKKITFIGDKSLSKRDMSRITIPLKKFGVNFKNKTNTLPLSVLPTTKLKPIKYFENLGSAQCKSAVIIAALKTQGKTFLKCKPSRNHTELILKNVLKAPIKLKKKKNFDLIEIQGKKEFKSFKYDIPSDISSAAFFIVLTLLGKNSSMIIKNINTNPTRTGIIHILNLMGAKIKLLNTKIYNGEKISDIFVKSSKTLKGINLNPKHNSSAIDEFLLIFLTASLCKGISTFKNLSELNKKESKRLNLGIKILRLMGIKVKKINKDGIKIWGNPNLEINHNIKINDYLKDHRIFMMSVIASLTVGGKWKIFDPDSIKTSFPSFLKLLKKCGAKIN